MVFTECQLTARHSWVLCRYCLLLLRVRPSVLGKEVIVLCSVHDQFQGWILKQNGPKYKVQWMS